jgi:type II secretory pathway pseudopilin PulG
MDTARQQAVVSLLAMSSRRATSGRTFSLLELALALLLLAAAATVAIPALQGRELLEAEEEALDGLRMIVSAQQAFRTRAGRPVLAFLDELAGRELGRELPIAPPLLPPSEIKDGIWTHGDHHFVLYLITAEGLGLLRPDPRAGNEFPHFLAYAWPRRYGHRGRQVFAIDEQGRLFATENAVRSREGLGGAPPFAFIGAALGPDHPLTRAAHRTEGQRWSQLEPGSRR